MKTCYPEEFKRNTMAVIKTGYAINPLAKRLGIPSTTIRNWIHRPDFAEVQPAGEELLAALPTTPQAQTSALVPITESEKKDSPVGEIKLKVGKMEMNLPQNFGKDSLVTIIKALGVFGQPEFHKRGISGYNKHTWRSRCSLTLIHTTTMYLPEPRI